MENIFIHDKGEITKFKFYGNTDIVIPRIIDGYPIHTIGYNAFSDTPITSVVIPSNIKTFKSSAFANCKSLESITIEGDNITIPSSFCYDNLNLKYFKIKPDSIKSINFFAFCGCNKLSTLQGLSSSTKISIKAFYNSKYYLKEDLFDNYKLGLLDKSNKGDLTEMGVISIALRKSGLTLLEDFKQYRTSLISVSTFLKDNKKVLICHVTSGYNNFNFTLTHAKMIINLYNSLDYDECYIIWPLSCSGSSQNLLDSYNIRLLSIDFLHDQVKKFTRNDINEILKHKGANGIFDEKSHVKNKRSLNPQKFSNPEDMSMYYQILSCNPSDSLEQITKRYKELAIKFHPDILASYNLPKEILDLSSDKFIEILEAYEKIKLHKKNRY